MVKRLRKIFFDFNNLTPFERRWMRRIFPFWTWYREIARVTLSMPGRFPGRAAILKGIGDLGEQVQEEEFRKHMGFRPKDFPQYLRGNTFIGFDIDGNTVFFSARGLNVFYGIGQNPFSGLRPELKALIESNAGGRQMGRWGSFIPFRFLKQFKGRTGTGEEVGPGVTAKTFLSELVRSIPQVRLAEDVAQYVTEGQVTQRFMDVTPLSNLPGPFQADPTTGLAPEPRKTAVLQPSREFRAKGQRPLGQAFLNFLGLPIVRYRIEEILEQELKAKKSPVSTIWRQLYIADPEFRAKMDQFILQNVGKMTTDEGLRAFRPEKKGK